jgi:hypothetical protein
MKKVEFIDDIRDAYKFWSVRIMALGAVVISYLSFFPVDALWLWAYMPAEVKAFIPDNIANILAVLIFLISILARVIKQDNVK